METRRLGPEISNLCRVDTKQILIKAIVRTHVWLTQTQVIHWGGCQMGR